MQTLTCITYLFQIDYLLQHVKETTSPYYNIENPDDKLKNLLLEVGFHIEDCYLSTETRTAPSREILFGENIFNYLQILQ